MERVVHIYQLFIYSKDLLLELYIVKLIKDSASFHQIIY